MGKSTISTGPFSRATLNYQRVFLSDLLTSPNGSIPIVIHFEWDEHPFFSAIIWGSLGVPGF